MRGEDGGFVGWTDAGLFVVFFAHDYVALVGDVEFEGAAEAICCHFGFGFLWLRRKKRCRDGCCCSWEVVGRSGSGDLIVLWK